MRKRKMDTSKMGENVVDYRHKTVTRLNIPPAGLEARGEIAREKRIRWAYNPHLVPALRFDAHRQSRCNFRTHRGDGETEAGTGGDEASL